jgi:hypothetical protein
MPVNSHIVYSETHTHTHTHTQVMTILVSMCDRSTVDRNIEAAMRPLILKEQTVIDEIMRQYFTPLQLTHWEGVEEEHKRQLKELNDLYSISNYVFVDLYN